MTSNHRQVHSRQFGLGINVPPYRRYAQAPLIMLIGFLFIAFVPYLGDARHPSMPGNSCSFWITIIIGLLIVWDGKRQRTQFRPKVTNTNKKGK